MPHPAYRLALASLLSLAIPGTVHAQGRCGEQRWPVKTLADRDASLVDTIPTPTSVAELVAIPRPTTRCERDGRTGPVELTTFLLRARLVRVLPQDDLDIHLVVRDLDTDSLTLVTEVPDSTCVADPRLGRKYNDVRRTLRSIPRDAVIEFTGVGFFDYEHGQSGMADNGIEIHPLLSLRRVNEAPSPSTSMMTSDATGQCRNGRLTYTAAITSACANSGGLALWWGVKTPLPLRPPLVFAGAAPSGVTPDSSGVRPQRIEVSTDTVWINLNSNVYHCRGSATYGTTARGRYATETEAVQGGARPAGGRRCGSARPR